MLDAMMNKIVDMSSPEVRVVDAPMSKRRVNRDYIPETRNTFGGLSYYLWCSSTLRAPSLIKINHMKNFYVMVI